MRNLKNYFLNKLKFEFFEKLIKRNLLIWINLAFIILNRNEKNKIINR
jgi:hypothetical protein